MTHRTSKDIEMGKNIQLISRLLQECPHPELRIESPLDSLKLPSPNGKGILEAALKSTGYFFPFQFPWERGGPYISLSKMVVTSKCPTRKCPASKCPQAFPYK